MTRPRLLDLFCGAGGAAMGYHRAGFDVVGVDIRPQPRYPFEFHQADAMTFPLDGFDAIHASPPCQAYSGMKRHPQNLVAPREHPDLVAPTRFRLMATGVPWVMENVVGAPLQAHIILCGTMFGFAVDGHDLQRHRLFETSGLFILTPPCSHRGRSLGVYGRLGKGWRRPVSATATASHASTAEAQMLMGIDWMEESELTQAIPPAYTEYIGRQLLAALEVAA